MKRESLETLELDACLTIPYLFAHPDRDAIVDIHVVVFIMRRRNRKSSYESQTDYRMIVGLQSREISWIGGISFRNETMYHQKMI